MANKTVIGNRYEFKTNICAHIADLRQMPSREPILGFREGQLLAGLSTKTLTPPRRVLLVSAVIALSTVNCAVPRMLRREQHPPAGDCLQCDAGDPRVSNPPVSHIRHSS